MDRINAERVGHWQQNRRQNQDQRRHIHQRTDQQQHDVNAHQNDVFVVRDAGEGFSDTHRQLHISHDGAERSGKAYQDHDDRDRFHRAEHQLWQLRPFIVTIDKHGDKEGPKAGNRSRLRRGKDT